MPALRRRKFITLLGGAAVWPLAAHAQQAAMPVIGYFSARSPVIDGPMLSAFWQGLSDTGFVAVCRFLRWLPGSSVSMTPVRECFQDRRAASVSTSSSGIHWHSGVRRTSGDQLPPHMLRVVASLRGDGVVRSAVDPSFIWAMSVEGLVASVSGYICHQRVTKCVAVLEQRRIRADGPKPPSKAG
jgi:hypothetical protein